MECLALQINRQQESGWSKCFVTFSPVDLTMNITSREPITSFLSKKFDLFLSLMERETRDLSEKRKRTFRRGGGSEKKTSCEWRSNMLIFYYFYPVTLLLVSLYVERRIGIEPMTRK